MIITMFVGKSIPVKMLSLCLVHWIDVRLPYDHVERLCGVPVLYHVICVQQVFRSRSSCHVTLMCSSINSCFREVLSPGNPDFC